MFCVMKRPLWLYDDDKHEYVEGQKHNCLGGHTQTEGKACMAEIFTYSQPGFLSLSGLEFFSPIDVRSTLSCVRGKMPCDYNSTKTGQKGNVKIYVGSLLSSL